MPPSHPPDDRTDPPPGAATGPHSGFAERRARRLIERGVALRRNGDPTAALTEYTAAIGVPNAPADVVALALGLRSQLRGNMGDLRGSLADADRLLTQPDLPGWLRAEAQLGRGLVRGDAGDVAGELADLDAVIDASAATDVVRAEALVSRAVIRGQAGQVDSALADLDAALGLPDLPPNAHAGALVARATLHWQRQARDRAMADFAAAVGLPEAPAPVRAHALLSRASLRTAATDAEGAAKDCTAVLALRDALPEQRAAALAQRAAARVTLGRLAGAANDYDRLRVLAREENVGIGVWAEAMLRRALLAERRHRDQEAEALYGELIDTPLAPRAARAQAHYQRALLRHDRGDDLAALADYAGTIELAEAGEPTLPVAADARYNRGLLRERRGEAEQALQDYLLVTGRPEVPPSVRAAAQAGVGMLFFQADLHDEAVDALQRALQLDPEQPWIHGSLGLALLHLNRTDEALQHYAAAAAAIADREELEVMVADDLADALQRNPSLSGGDQARQLVEARREELGKA